MPQVSAPSSIPTPIPHRRSFPLFSNCVAQQIGKRRLILAGLLLAVGLGGGFLACSPADPEEADVILLHTGRLRGNLYPLSLQEIAPLQHYPFLVSYIESVREEAARTGARVILIDMGDSLEGSFASYATDSANVAAYFNETGYDAILLGNLDNQVTPAQLAPVEAAKLSPFLSPEGNPALPGTRVAARLELPPTATDPLPLAVFLVANFYGDTSVEEFPDRFPSSFGKASSGVIPDRRPVNEVLQNLLGDGPLPPNRLVLFAWMKFEAPEEPPQGFLQHLREAGVDAILAQRVYGQAQMDVWGQAALPEWEPPVSQNILRQNGGFTLARMDLQRSGQGWRVLRQNLLPMTANTAPPSQAAIARQEDFAGTIAQADRSLGQAPEPISEETLLQACLVGLTRLPGAEAVVYSPQSIRSDIPAGTLSTSRLFQAIPWTGPLVSLELSAEKLARAQEQNPGWIFWERAGETNPASPSVPVESEAGLTLMTSRFFGGILVRQLDLPSQALRAMASSEFAYFSDFLARNPVWEMPLDAPPEGWNRVPATPKPASAP